MIKLIWISDKENKGITFWFFTKFSQTDDEYYVKGEEAEEIIKNESTDFLFLKIKRPANTDAMQRPGLYNINRLRVSVFTFSPFKSRIIKFLFPPEIIKTVVHNVIISSKSV